MTKEQTIAAAKVMLAWAEGKQVEYRDKASKKEWVKVIGNIPLWDWWGSEYRIKPEPAYRPFETAEEVMEANQRSDQPPQRVVLDKQRGFDVQPRQEDSTMQREQLKPR